MARASITVVLALTIVILASNTGAKPQLGIIPIRKIQTEDPSHPVTDSNNTEDQKREIIRPSTSASIPDTISRFRRDVTQPLPNGYKNKPGIGTHKFHATAKTWKEARSVCQAEGGDLAVVNSPEEAEVIAGLSASAQPHSGSEDNERVFLGFHDRDNNRNFVTIQGSSIEDAGFATWHPGSPGNSKGPGFCGALHDYCGGLDDISCSTKLAFVCELNDFQVGPSGPVGAQGDPGNKGDQGAPGSPGSNGLKGDKGDLGATGPPGPVGPPGTDGVQGLKGDQGEPGSLGPAGLRGEKGDMGAAGAPGSPGNNGVPGHNGFNGKDGSAGAPGLNGSKGEPGDKGADGLQGIQGEKGDTGLKGDTGPLGPRGPIGLTGPPGEAGPFGRSGPKGAQGEPGMPGIFGQKGKSGMNGAPGPQGRKGETGSPGPRGKTGLGFSAVCMAALANPDSKNNFAKECGRFITKVIEQMSETSSPNTDQPNEGRNPGKRDSPKSPVKTCKDLFVADPDMPSGRYQIDPNGGDDHDAILVQCDAKERSTCVLPKFNRLYPIPHIGDEREVWLSTLGTKMQITYEATSDQISALQMLSSHAEQNVTYHCVKSVGYYDAEGRTHERGLKLLAWNDFELVPKGSQHFNYDIVSDGCQDRLDEWRKTVISYRTDKPARLPVTDVGFRDVGKRDQHFSVEIGGVCFR